MKDPWSEIKAATLPELKEAMRKYGIVVPEVTSKEVSE